MWVTSRSLMIPVVAVSTGFPTGLSPKKTKILEIKESIRSGAQEIDIVISRRHVLSGNWKRLYDEISEYKEASGNAHLKTILATGELGTLKNIAKFQAVALVPGRGDALIDPRKIEDALALTEDFVNSTFRSVSKIAHAGGDLKEAMSSCRDQCDKKFSDYAIYEHCLPFNVSRAFDEAKGIDNPRIWTAERDKEMWEMLQ